VGSGFGKEKTLDTLQELLDIEGVVAAVDFSLDGSLLTYEAKIDMSEQLAQKTAQYCAAISLTFNTLASSFTDLSGMNWVPQHGWAYSGGEWTACIGADGKRGVLVETSLADFNELFEALGGER
jgi:roadblock/LC7 domain-containing protein